MKHLSENLTLVGDLCEFDVPKLSGTQEVLAYKLSAEGIPGDIIAATICTRSPSHSSAEVETNFGIDPYLWEMYSDFWRLTDKQQDYYRAEGLYLLPGEVGGTSALKYTQPKIHQVGIEFWGDLPLLDAFKLADVTEGPLATFECPHCKVDPSKRKGHVTLKTHSVGVDTDGSIVVKKATSGNLADWQRINAARCNAQHVFQDKEQLSSISLGEALALGVRPTGVLNYKLIPMASDSLVPNKLLLRRYTSFKGVEDYKSFVDNIGLVVAGIEVSPTAPIHVWTVDEAGLRASRSDEIQSLATKGDTASELYWDWLDTWNVFLETPEEINAPKEPSLILAPNIVADAQPYLEDGCIIVPVGGEGKKIKPKIGSLSPVLIVLSNYQVILANE